MGSRSFLSFPVQKFSLHISVVGAPAVESEVARSVCYHTGVLVVLPTMCVEPTMCGIPLALQADFQYAISSVNGYVRHAVNGEVAVAAAKAGVDEHVRRSCVYSSPLRGIRWYLVCWGLCNQVFAVLFRRSTGRQRHLVPSPISPPFAVLVSRLTSIRYDVVLYVTHSAVEDSLSCTGEAC